MVRKALDDNLKKMLSQREPMMAILKYRGDPSLKVVIDDNLREGELRVSRDDDQCGGIIAVCRQKPSVDSLIANVTLFRDGPPLGKVWVTLLHDIDEQHKNIDQPLVEFVCNSENCFDNVRICADNGAIAMLIAMKGV